MMIYDATTRRCFVWLEHTIGSKGKMNRNKYSLRFTRWVEHQRIATKTTTL